MAVDPSGCSSRCHPLRQYCIDGNHTRQQGDPVVRPVTLHNETATHHL